MSTNGIIFQKITKWLSRCPAVVIDRSPFRNITSNWSFKNTVKFNNCMNEAYGGKINLPIKNLEPLTLCSIWPRTIVIIVLQK